MKLEDAKQKYLDVILDRPYRRIQLLIDGTNSSWKDDIKLEILTSEDHLRSFTTFISKLLNSLNKPYTIYNAKREAIITEEDKNIYITDRQILEDTLRKFIETIN